MITEKISEIVEGDKTKLFDPSPISSIEVSTYIYIYQLYRYVGRPFCEVDNILNRRF